MSTTKPTAGATAQDEAAPENKETMTSVSLTDQIRASKLARIIASDNPFPYDAEIQRGAELLAEWRYQDYKAGALGNEQDATASLTSDLKRAREEIEQMVSTDMELRLELGRRHIRAERAEKERDDYKAEAQMCRKAFETSTSVQEYNNLKAESAALRTQLAEAGNRLEASSDILRLIGTTWTDESNAHTIAYREADANDKLRAAIDQAASTPKSP